MRPLETTLSDTITFYARQFDECAHTGCTLSAEETDRLVRQLKSLSKLARNLEQEIAVRRLAEARRMQNGELEQQAGIKFAQMIADPEGKIVRPDFKGGRKS